MPTGSRPRFANERTYLYGYSVSRIVIKNPPQTARPGVRAARDFLHGARTTVLIWAFSTDCETSLKVSSPFLGSVRGIVVSWYRTSVWAFSKDCEESRTHPSVRFVRCFVASAGYYYVRMGGYGVHPRVLTRGLPTDRRTERPRPTRHSLIIMMRRSAFGVLFVRRSGATTTTTTTTTTIARGFGGDPSTSSVDRADVRRARAAEKRRLRALRGGTGSEEDGTGTGGGGDGGDRRRRQRAGRRASSSSASSSAFESFVDGMERAGRRASDGFNFASGRRKERGRRGERAFDSSAQASAAFEAFVRARLRNDSFGGTGGVGGSSSSFEDFFSGGSGGSNGSNATTTTRNDDGFYAGASCPHCAILGLKAKSFVTWDGLKTALRTQAMKWHPDRHADEDKTRAEANFKRVYDAYAALSRR